MNPFDVVIVDDEADSIELLQLMLKKNFQTIRSVKSFSNSSEALVYLEMNRPDILFLDIEMPELTGFDLLTKLMPVSFKVIFITAFHQYAHRAFRYNALDYLLKPVELELLQESILRMQSTPFITPLQVKYLQQQLDGNKAERIAIATQTGVSFVILKDILYIEANGNYSKFTFLREPAIIVSKTLKDIQEILEQNGFLRVHRQYIINLNRIKNYNRNDGLLKMDNNEILPVARLQREKLIQNIKWL